MPHILIVDDHPEVLELLQETLDIEAYAVSTATTGQDALDQIRAYPPDLVIMDWMLPEAIDGLEVIRTVKQDPALASVSCLMLSAKGQEADRAQARAAGIDGYITKPFSPMRLLALVNDILGT